MSLPHDSASRKRMPMFSGLIKYFPDALAAVAALSFEANEKHNPGEPLHWSKEKSNDHADCCIRHLTDYAAGNRLALRENAWRSLALLQIDIEQNGPIVSTEYGKPVFDIDEYGKSVESREASPLEEMARKYKEEADASITDKLVRHHDEPQHEPSLGWIAWDAAAYRGSPPAVSGPLEVELRDGLIIPGKTVSEFIWSNLGSGTIAKYRSL